MNATAVTSGLLNQASRGTSPRRRPEACSYSGLYSFGPSTELSHSAMVLPHGLDHLAEDTRAALARRRQAARRSAILTKRNQPGR